MADLHPALLAFLLGALGGPVGGLVAAVIGWTVLSRARTWIRGAALGFSGGFILAVAFVELVARGLQESEGWHMALVPAGLAVGAVLRAGLVHTFTRSDPSDFRDGGYHAQQARKLAVTLAAENLLEGMSLGIALAVDLELGLVVAGLLIVDTFAEGMTVSTELAEGEHGLGQMLLLTGAPPVLLGVGGALGAWIGGLSPALLAAMFGTTAGIMLHAVIDDVIYDAHRIGDRKLLSLPLLIGIVGGTAVVAAV